MAIDRGRVHLGTSGWHYDDWAGLVYPTGLPRARWFAEYATRFDAVEINASFYRLPAETTIEGWRAQAPPGFTYAAKGSRFTTHDLKIGGDRLPSSVTLVTGRLRGLGEHLGVVLWQLPPTLHRDVDRLDRFCGLLPGWTRHALEARHASWDHADVDAVLADHGVARVWTSSSFAPQPARRTTDLVYLRFHGLSDQAYLHDYSDAELEPWADRVAEALDSGADAHVYFNNDFRGHAVRNAERFGELLARLGSPPTRARASQGAPS
jgi:uncharacterized protein YecE (DUF72 family)